MRCSIVLFLFGLAAVTCVKATKDTYPDKYDSIDLREILNNRHLLIAYLKCLLDLGKCTPEGKLLKSHIKEAIEEDCAKCTPAQRNGTELVLAHLIKHEPDYWKQLKVKFDSSGKFSAEHEKNLTSRMI